MILNRYIDEYLFKLTRLLELSILYPFGHINIHGDYVILLSNFTFVIDEEEKTGDRKVYF